MQSGTVVAQSTLRRPGETQASGDLTEGASVEKRRISAFLTSKVRIDRQVAYPAAKEKAKAAITVAWSGYEEWKETKALRLAPKQ